MTPERIAELRKLANGDRPVNEAENEINECLDAIEALQLELSPLLANNQVIKDATHALDGCGGIVDTWLGDQVRALVKERDSYRAALLEIMDETANGEIVGPIRNIAIEALK